MKHCTLCRKGYKRIRSHMHIMILKHMYSEQKRSAESIVGPPEKRHTSWEVGQKYMSSTNFSPRHGSVGGSAEMRRKPWEVDQKIFDDNACSVQNHTCVSGTKRQGVPFLKSRSEVIGCLRDFICCFLNGVKGAKGCIINRRKRSRPTSAPTRPSSKNHFELLSYFATKRS